MNALVRQIEADDELRDERPNITSQDVKDWFDQSHEDARALTDNLTGFARQVTEPISSAINDWAESGANDNDALQKAQDAALEAGYIPGTASYDLFAARETERINELLDRQVPNFTPAYLGATPANIPNPVSGRLSFNVTPESARYTRGEDLMSNSILGNQSFNVLSPFEEQYSLEDNRRMENIYSALPDYWTDTQKGEYLWVVYHNPNFAA